MNDRDYLSIANGYANDVLSGKIPACRWVKLACKRSINDQKASLKPSYPYAINPKKITRVCRFLESFRHIEGDKGGELLVLDPWQIWYFGNLFGWLHKSTGKRRFRIAHLEVPRGNGKSFLLSAIALFMLSADGEAGPQVWCAAVDRQQAGIVFRGAQAHVRDPRNAQLMHRLGIQVTRDRITIPSLNASMMPLPRNATSQDGKNIHLAVMDELHSWKTRDMWDVLRSGMNKRSNNLLFAITTAGYDIANIGAQQNEYCKGVLEGRIPADEFFGVIYTIDKDDDWTDPKSWEKANPCWHSAINVENFKNQVTKAMHQPADQAEVKVKLLNIWGSSALGWADIDKWAACQDSTLKLADFKGKECFIGVDLAVSNDLCAKALIFPEQRGSKRHYTVFLTYYLPQAAVDAGKNASYKGWQAQKLLTVHPGEATDFQWVGNDIIKDIDTYKVKAVGIDPWSARDIAQRLLDLRAPVQFVRQGMQTLSNPTKYLDELTRTGCLHCSIDPILMWMANNVRIVPDDNENIKPSKSASIDKIDGIMAILCGMCFAMIAKETRPSSYANSKPYVYGSTPTVVPTTSTMNKSGLIPLFK